MQFEELRVRNFLSLGPDEQVLPLSNRGLVLIDGKNLDDQTTVSNGSGKSSLIEALIWCIFGKTIRGYEADAVVNRVTGSNCCCKLTLTHDNGTAYRIERYRKDSEEKNRLRLFSAKEELTRSDSSATQELINSVLGMTYDTFVNSVVFGQGAIKHFAQMTDKEQKVIMDRLIGIERLTQGHEAAKTKLRELNEDLVDLGLDELDANVHASQDTVMEAETDASKWLDKHNAKLKSLSDEIKKSVTEEDRFYVAALIKKTKKVTDAAHERREEMLKLKTATHGQATSLLEQTEQARNRLNRVNKKTGKCPGCGSVVSSEDLHEHRKELENDVSLLENEYEKVRLEFQKARDGFDKATEDLMKAKQASDEAESAKYAIVARDQVADRVKQERETVKAEVNPYTKQLLKLNEKLVAAEEKLAAAKKQASKLRKEIRYVEFVVGMLSDKGTKEYPPLKGCLLDNVAPFLNEQANKYSNFITGANIHISFDTQRTLSSGDSKEEFGVKAVNQYGSEDYEGCSGGERQKINVCVALALQAQGASRSFGSLNIAFYDEIFESLDDAAVDRVMDLLREEAKTKDSLFVVTHLASLKAQFPEVITVVKENGCSTIT